MVLLSIGTARNRATSLDNLQLQSAGSLPVQGSSAQTISDYRCLLDCMMYYTWYHIDCPNRGTTAVRRFCYANSLPVILLPAAAFPSSLRIEAAGSAAPTDAATTIAKFDDTLLCHALRAVGVNYLHIVVNSDGVPSPALLTGELRAAAASSIRAKAEAFSQLTVDAPAPRDLSNLTPEEVERLRFVKLGMFHSAYLENFFSMTRGATFVRGCGFGALPSDAWRRRFGRAMALYCYRQSQGDRKTVGETIPLAPEGKPDASVLFCRRSSGAGVRINSAPGAADGASQYAVSGSVLASGRLNAPITVANSLLQLQTPQQQARVQRT